MRCIRLVIHFMLSVSRVSALLLNNLSITRVRTVCKHLLIHPLHPLLSLYSSSTPLAPQFFFSTFWLLNNASTYHSSYDVSLALIYSSIIHCCLSLSGLVYMVSSVK